MKAYIKSVGIVSPQFSGCRIPDNFQPLDYTSPSIHCTEPVYKDLINPVYLRRMPKILKMGLYAAITCLKSGGVEIPDAIITGTGLGCIDELEKFLAQMLQTDEQNISPHAFINSSHHIVASQLAVILKSQCYNMNYMHRSFSFENAVLDAMMLIEEKEAQHVLCGSMDEITPYHFDVNTINNSWKKEPVHSLNLFSHGNTAGTIAGEGSAFFLLSSDRNGAIANISGISTLYLPESKAAIENKIDKLIKQAGLSPDDIDILFCGKNGDARFDSVYDEIAQSIFPKSAVVCYKHLCGEYYTASSFATAIAAFCIEKNEVLPFLNSNKEYPGEIKNILIYNQFNGIYHSFILIQRNS